MEKVILFDIGKTLIDGDAIINGALEHSAKKLKKLKFIDDEEKFIIAYLEADKDTTFAHIHHTYSDFEIIKKAWKNLGREDNYKVYANFLLEYRNYVRSKIKPDSKILKTFQHLQNKKMLLGIASDGTIVEQLETLVRLRIISYLEPNLIFVSEDIGVEKTNKDFYKYILQKNGNPNRRMVIVGDRLEADILIPKQLGFKTVLVLKYAKYIEEKIKYVNPDFVINDIPEMERIADLI
ncbi:MAG: HAD-IA family hydrolase [bacterium]